MGGPSFEAIVLAFLRVQNLAIIDELEVELGPGLNVVTGETGAGKSILVNALSLVLGARARPEMLRTGADSGEVEALFDVGDDDAARARVAAAGVEVQDELVLRRVVPRSGRSRAYVNGKLATAAQLAELAEGLADISSQHQHHTLVDPQTHLFFLDAFGKLEGARRRVAEAHQALVRALAELAEQSRRLQDRGEREDLLRFQIGEIDDVAPERGELERLKTQRDRQRHGERLAQVTSEAAEVLYERDEALCAQLARVEAELRHAAELDAELSPLADTLASATAQVEDAARELGAYARGVSWDPQQLAELDDRVDAITRLCRKHGGDVDAVLAFRQRAADELAQLDRSEERLADLERAVEEARKQASREALALSKARRAAADELASAVSAELKSLSMGDARIAVEVDRVPGGDDAPLVDGARLSSTGIDRVEFLIAANPGEAPQPLRRIASGGELSRAMLAVKRTLAGLGPGGLYVFDEVDAGVGGAVAEVIGRKLREVSRHHQVICITHLPQIAAFADAHFHVDKAVVDGRTRSRIVRLSAKEQREEIARMLGGTRITDKTRAAASEMLRASR